MCSNNLHTHTHPRIIQREALHLGPGVHHGDTLKRRSWVQWGRKLSVMCCSESCRRCWNMETRYMSRCFYTFNWEMSASDSRKVSTRNYRCGWIWTVISVLTQRSQILHTSMRPGDIFFPWRWHWLKLSGSLTERVLFSQDSATAPPRTPWMSRPISTWC